MTWEGPSALSFLLNRPFSQQCVLFLQKGAALVAPFSVSADPTRRLEDLANDRAPGFVQVFLEIGHEGRAARSYCAGVAGMNLVLAMDVTIGVSDMDVAKLCQ